MRCQNLVVSLHIGPSIRRRSKVLATLDQHTDGIPGAHGSAMPQDLGESYQHKPQVDAFQL